MIKHLYYYAPVSRPFADVSRDLAGDPRTWLPEPAQPCDGGFEVRLHAEHALPPPVASRTAIVTVGPVAVGPHGLLRAVTWRAAGHDQLFPVLTADLEVEPLGDEATQVSLMGTYRPPLSVVGGAADALVGHRIAQACVRTFVESLAGKVGLATLPA